MGYEEALYVESRLSDIEKRLEHKDLQILMLTDLVSQLVDTIGDLTHGRSN